MSEFLQLTLTQLLATSVWEWIAVVLALAYIWLAVQESLWCWPAAFFSTLIYAVLFFDVNLYMESLLNLYYLLMAIYGFYQWRQKPQTDLASSRIQTKSEIQVQSSHQTKPVITWSLNFHLLLIVTVSSLVLISGLVLETYTNQDFAYIDSFTTWFAVVTTYMVAQKVLENWLYWIVIDGVSIYLYLQKGFAMTALLFMLYILMAVIGWKKWRAHYQQQLQLTETCPA